MINPKSNTLDNKVKVVGTDLPIEVANLQEDRSIILDSSKLKVDVCSQRIEKVKNLEVSLTLLDKQEACLQDQLNELKDLKTDLKELRVQPEQIEANIQGIRLSPYEKITEYFISAIENSKKLPWQIPYSLDVPVNFAGREYRGINWLMLNFVRNINNFSSNRWFTFRQVQEIGGRVKKGSTGVPIVFWESKIKENNGKDAKINGEKGDLIIQNVVIMRTYFVFNRDQCEMPESFLKNEKRIILDAKLNLSQEKVYENYLGRPEVKVDNMEIPSYNPMNDVINIPDVAHFHNDSDWYYDTLFHELVHSTGHEKRLDRGFPIHKGTVEYAREELTAEIGACILHSCTNTTNQIKAEPNINATDNNVAYIKYWFELLRKDKQLLIIAASRATKAVNHILSINDKTKPDEVSE